MFEHERKTKPPQNESKQEARAPRQSPHRMGNQAALSALGSQRAQPSASGGVPLGDAMRARFERQFGLPMDDVRIHSNSERPSAFDADAFTYGHDIYLGAGQEALLPHEMTHVAQQKLGQVRPTGMEHGMAVNHSPVLEHSAAMGTLSQTAGSASGPVVQCGRKNRNKKGKAKKEKQKSTDDETRSEESDEDTAAQPAPAGRGRSLRLPPILPAPAGRGQGLRLPPILPPPGRQPPPAVEERRAENNHMPPIGGRDLARHHIIPIPLMQEIANRIITFTSCRSSGRGEEAELYKNVTQLKKALISNYLKMWDDYIESVGDENKRAEALKGKNAAEKDFQRMMVGEEEDEIENNELFKEMFAWMPGNLVIGPEGSYRNADPGKNARNQEDAKKAFDEEANQIKLKLKLKNRNDIKYDPKKIFHEINSYKTGETRAEEAKSLNSILKAMKPIYSDSITDAREEDWDLDDRWRQNHPSGG